MLLHLCIFLFTLQQINAEIIGNNTEINNDNNKTETVLISERISAPYVENHTRSLQDGFRPSIQLESFVEYNKFPVEPALPESKHISTPLNVGEVPNNWYPKIRFPTQDVQPYFYPRPSTTEKPAELWDKHEIRRPDTSYYASKTGGHGGFPWKTVIKFLTTVIPIGLLISALTPTVITVTPTNETQSRFRLEEPTRRLANSLNYFNDLNGEGCQDRVLCELLLSASNTKDAKEHVQNILEAFVENGGINERKNEIKTVFDAVKNQDCTPILCNKINKKFE